MVLFYWPKTLKTPRFVVSFREAASKLQRLEAPLTSGLVHNSSLELFQLLTALCNRRFCWHNQHLIYALAIHVHDLEAQPVPLEVIGLGQGQRYYQPLATARDGRVAEEPSVMITWTYGRK